MNGVKDGGADPDDGKNRKMAEYLRYSAAGTQLFVASGMGLGAGLWLDSKLGWLPILTILGTFVGFAGGFYTLYMELFGRKR